MNRSDIHRVFGEAAYLPVKDILVTPEMVADRIDTHLGRRE